MGLILKPFSWLITLFCHLFNNNYGMALILFAIVVKIILFPFSLKGKRSMVKMSAVQSKAQRIQKQYANNRQKQQEEIQKLYAKENVNPMGGCLWSFLPLLLLIPLYSIIRQPLSYMMDLATESVNAIAAVLGYDLASNAGYGQLQLAALITPDKLAAVKSGMATQAAALYAGQSDVITAVAAQVENVFSINFNFLGLDLALQPTWQIWTDWSHLGVNLLPVLSAALSVLMSVVTQKTNKMSNPNAGEQKSGTFMLYVFSPLMSLWIGYIMPAGLCIYWIVNSLLSMLQEVLAGRLLKKDYEAAAEQARKQALLDKEEEKRRRAALAAERARRAEEKKQKGKKKDKEKDREPGVDRSASRVGIRAYARGRAYDPDRFGGVTPYRDPDHPVDEEAIEQIRAQRDEKRAEAQLEADITAQVAAEMADLAGRSADEVEAALGKLEEDRERAALDEADALAAELTQELQEPEDPEAREKQGE